MSGSKTLREKVSDVFGVDESEVQHGVITNIQVIDGYSAYYYDEFTIEQDDGTIPATKGLKSPALEETQRKVCKDSRIKDFALAYDPEVAITVELHNTETPFHFKSVIGSLSSWKPTNSILQLVHQQVGITNVSESCCVPIIYGPSKVYAQADNGLLSRSRRLFRGEPTTGKFPYQDEGQEYTEDLTRLESYLDYLKKSYHNPTEWVETTIDSFELPQPEEFPIRVNTPTGTARFVFEEGGTLNEIGFDELFDKLDISKPSEIENKTVYIRPRYKKFSDNKTKFSTTICEYTDNSDDDQLWELSVANPNASDETTMGQKSSHKLQAMLDNSRIEKAIKTVTSRLVS
jgi:hypothetical protein